MLKSLFPQTHQFYDLFERHAALTVEAALFLQKELATEQGDDGIKRLEHQADKVTQECIAALHRTFITPIDRDLIHQLITELDDVIDDIDKTADCLTIYKVHKANGHLVKLSNLVVAATHEVQLAVVGLRHLEKEEAIQMACREIRQIEHNADIALREALIQLFDEEPDARMIIKMKDIYESLESATDRCADVADVIETILIEND